VTAQGDNGWDAVMASYGDDEVLGKTQAGAESRLWGNRMGA